MFPKNAELPKILIAEDERVSREILQGIFEDWGYVVLVVDNGLDARKILLEEQNIVVLLDWVMPGMDGIDVCREVMRWEKKFSPYLIVLTGKSQKKDVVLGLNAGANDYVLKPYDRDELKARVDVGVRFLKLQKELCAALESMERIALTDELTELPNRRNVFGLLKESLVQESSKNILTLAIMDIDFFKKINDEHGHGVGDEVLREFARRLRATFTPGDFAGRIGGEEFMVVSPKGTFDHQKFNQIIQCRPFEVQKKSLDVTVSVGVCTYTGQSLDALVGMADKRLYGAKGSGRNRVVCRGDG